ncbi:hypothetical protein QQF64_021380 [Cirrhinus molitorella]|uniref:Uncharacterized protein n=1 Tax=Cirrhinus molitorella TaxID=172907 RepID=A0ABR3LDB0_9TELE
MTEEKNRTRCVRKKEGKRQKNSQLFRAGPGFGPTLKAPEGDVDGNIRTRCEIQHTLARTASGTALCR